MRRPRLPRTRNINSHRLLIRRDQRPTIFLILMRRRATTFRLTHRMRHSHTIIRRILHYHNINQYYSTYTSTSPGLSITRNLHTPRNISRHTNANNSSVSVQMPNSSHRLLAHRPHSRLPKLNNDTRIIDRHSRRHVNAHITRKILSLTRPISHSSNSHTSLTQPGHTARLNNRLIRRRRLVKRTHSKIIFTLMQRLRYNLVTRINSSRSLTSPTSSKFSILNQR